MHEGDAGSASEQEVWAEHRAALDATLFAGGTAIVLFLRDGEFTPA